MNFPYAAAKNYLAEVLTKNLPEDLKNHSEKIIDLHLNQNTQAMPLMTSQQYGKVREMIGANQSLEKIIQSLQFEKTATKSGMFRVMARTHLNRSGINHVSQGYENKTLSPRILKFSESIDLTKNITTKDIIVKWYAFAEAHSADNVESSLKYDDRALNCLKKLANMDDIDEWHTSGGTAPGLSRKLGVDLGWCRIALGLTSGLMFLKRKNWNLYETVSQDNLGYDDIHALIKDCQKHICEYGYALAGSFLADLGGTAFVKDDTHVRACVLAVEPRMNKPEQRVKFVIESAHHCNISPRALDKLMYIAGSGNFPLLGLKINSSQQIKDSFIRKLPKISTH